MRLSAQSVFCNGDTSETVSVGRLFASSWCETFLGGGAAGRGGPATGWGLICKKFPEDCDSSGGRFGIVETSCRACISCRAASRLAIHVSDCAKNKGGEFLSDESFSVRDSLVTHSKNLLCGWWLPLVKRQPVGVGSMDYF